MSTLFKSEYAPPRRTKNICEHCANHRLSRVVHPIDSFTIQADPTNSFSKVECLVFELAQGDIRRHLNTAKTFDVAFCLRALHHVAIALEQLHSSGIAHQDLKPSNVLVFGKIMGNKVSDFGRAWSKDFRAAHDNYRVAGDQGYAPPELLYGYIPVDANLRRYGCDTYLLGSLGVFFFTFSHMDSMLIKHLDPAHYPYTWGGTYQDVLPYVQAAFSAALIEFSAAIPPEFRSDLREYVSYLCQPDPTLRGHPLNHQQNMNQFGLARFISKFDLLAAKAELLLARLRT